MLEKRNFIASHSSPEAKLEKSLSLLQATLDSTGEGVIAVSNSGDILSFNQKFVQMWQVPVAILKSCNYSQCLTFCSHQLQDSKTFFKYPNQITNQSDVEGYDTLELRDGRVIEQYCQVLRLNEQTIGTVWSFRDITKYKQAQTETRSFFEQENQIALNSANVSSNSSGARATKSIFPCDPLLSQVFEFIEHNYHQSIRLREVAQAVGYSAAYLTDLVRQKTGKTVNHWIVERRMAEARVLLLETNQSVNQIAEVVGYQYEGHFFRQFRQYNGTTPQAWRNARRI